MMSVKADKNKYKLCYVNNNIMYFTDNFENQWGDDWDDAPYEHNAGEPYEKMEGHNNDNCGNIKYLAFLKGWSITDPSDIASYNSQYSVEAINSGAISWLYDSDNKSALSAGATMEEAIKWCHQNNIKCGELI